MCDPKATAQLGLTFDVAAGLGSTALAYRGAQIEQTVAENNAKLAEMQAKDAIERGGRAELDVRRRGAKVRGRQVAGLAAGNVQFQGSALDILEETDRMTEADAQTVRDNAGREAWARRREAAGYRAQANGISPIAAGLTSLLSSAGRVADRWYDYTRDY